MNLYSKKQRWKIILVIIAAAIVGTSLWITGNIVNQIKEAEKQKVEQWANDIRNNIEQLNIQDSLLVQQKIANELLVKKEKEDITDWVAAMEELSKDHLDYSFFVQKIQANNSIPLIMLDHTGAVSEYRNLPFSPEDVADRSHIPDTTAKLVFKDSLKHICLVWAEETPPIELDYIDNKTFKVYYSQSQAVLEFQEKSEAYRQRSLELLKNFNDRLDKSIKQFPMAYVGDENEEIILSNLDQKVLNDPKKLREKLSEMKAENGTIPVKIGGNTRGWIYYKNSDLVQKLSYYPYIQFGIIGLFLLISYFLFSTFRKAEQNQVWVGMAKETAHQLGTPISSLMAWTELLKSQGIDDSTVTEITKDLNRLNTVTDRFSKIGSGGELTLQVVKPIIEEVYDYLEKRVSKKVTISIEGTDEKALINKPLLEWVIENLSKNAVDAMEGRGSLKAVISGNKKEVYIDISDTGKGISTMNQKRVFEPGFTTKKRGWGLGLSLVKRIVEEYHKGKVYVLKSEPGAGTTFRVVLQKS